MNRIIIGLVGAAATGMLLGSFGYGQGSQAQAASTATPVATGQANDAASECDHVDRYNRDRRRPRGEGDREMEDRGRPERGSRSREQYGDRAGRQPPTHHAIGRVFHLAIRTLKQTQDDGLKALVDKVVADRRLMLKTQANSIDAYTNLAAAAHAGNEEQIQEALEAQKQAHKATHQAGEKLRTDVEALAKLIRTLRPDDEPDAGQAGGRGRDRGQNGRGEESRRRRGNRNTPSPQDDVPPPID